MKKVWGIIFGITAMLCLFLMPGHSSIVSKAATDNGKEAVGTLVDGKSFNVAIKYLANGSAVMKTTDNDKKIQKIVFLKKNLTSKEKKALEKQKKISVGEGVYAYYGNGIISVYSTADRISFPQNSGSMFAYLDIVTDIDFGKNRINTKDVKDMEDMFCYCSSLKQIDFSEFDTSNVTTMKDLLHACTSIESIDMHGMDFSKLKSTSHMFLFCTHLKEVNLSNINALELINMESMFYDCSRLKNINFEGFKTRDLVFMDYMFVNCSSLSSLDLSSFDTYKLGDATYMFANCTGLKRLDLSTFRTPFLVNTESMFSACKNLEYLDISNFDLSEIANAEKMFTGCYELRTIIVPKATRQVLEFPLLMAIDNDRNGIPDTSQTFHKNPVSDRVNILIPYEDTLTAYAPKYTLPKTEAAKAEIIATENNVTYRLAPDGIAAVTHISASGKVVVDSIKYNGVSYPVTVIEAAACKGNKNIKSLKIGKNVTSIGKDAFKGCKNLKKITICGDKNIGKGAFRKIHKKATITVKDIKGKQKKKLLKAIIKQTDAKVK